jgi:hypothetical protein
VDIVDMMSIPRSIDYNTTTDNVENDDANMLPTEARVFFNNNDPDEWDAM